MWCQNIQFVVSEYLDPNCTVVEIRQGVTCHVLASRAPVLLRWIVDGDEGTKTAAAKARITVKELMGGDGQGQHTT